MKASNYQDRKLNFKKTSNRLRSLLTACLLAVPFGVLASDESGIGIASVLAQPCEEGDWRCKVFKPSGR